MSIDTGSPEDSIGSGEDSDPGLKQLGGESSDGQPQGPPTEMDDIEHQVAIAPRNHPFAGQPDIFDELDRKVTRVEIQEEEQPGLPDDIKRIVAVVDDARLPAKLVIYGKHRKRIAVEQRILRLVETAPDVWEASTGTHAAIYVHALVREAEGPFFAELVDLGERGILRTRFPDDLR